MDLVAAEIEAYAEAHSSDPDQLFEELAKETRESGLLYIMQVGKVEGRFLRMLVQMCGAKRAVEIGTFTGYSGLCIAEGLADGGSLITCDVDPTATDIARRYWAKSPHGKKIELRLGPAIDTLKTIEGPLDFVFIDADKQNYANYWDAVVPKLRSGGLIAVDNVLWSGRVLNPTDELDIAVASFNDKVMQDDRVELVMLTVRDGITLARKK